jgi:hypothetical protein
MAGLGHNAKLTKTVYAERGILPGALSRKKRKQQPALDAFTLWQTWYTSLFLNLLAA